MILWRTATTTAESLQQQQTYLFQLPLHPGVYTKCILLATANTPTIAIYDSDDNLRLNFH